MNALRLMFQATEQTQEKVKEVDFRVVQLEENVKIEPGEYAETNFTQSLSSWERTILQYEQAANSELFKALNKEVTEITGVKTRTQLKQKDFKVIDFIYDWELSKATSLLVICIRTN